LSLIRSSTGAIVNLGQLIGRGGEGTVHAVVGAPKLVAKIYLKAPDAAKSEKLRLMVRGKSPGLLGVAAWPIDLLRDERGAVRGFLMERISARQDAHRLYTPKSRRGTFPDADFRFVVRAATNLARAFAQIHAAGHVIGDVNHGNALIGKDGTAVLIDCDSIQVRERDRNRLFPCDVGTPLFTPPELQGKVFRGLRRTEASDRFGLAVLIFHLLFQGRHPYAGIFADGEMPIERAIAESRFAYGGNAASLGMSAPPGTLPLTTFGRPIARLFERAFAPPGGEEERPSAIEWIDALQELEQQLTACPTRPRHFYPRGTHCCWCEIERLTGAKLFDDGQTANIDADAVTAQELWMAIERIPPPAPPELPDFAARELTKIGREIGWVKRSENFLNVAVPLAIVGFLIFAGLGTAMGILFSSLGISLWVGNKVAKKNRGSPAPPSRLPRALRIEWKNAVAHWRKYTSAGLFINARSDLEHTRRSLEILLEKQRDELEGLERRHRPRQNRTFLESFEIDKALFVSVSRSHVELLANRGIRSAADLRRSRGDHDQLLPVAAETELRDWETQCARAFQFDKRDPAYLLDAAKIEEKYQKQRQHFLEKLRQGPALLAAKLDDIADTRVRAEDALRRKHEVIRKRRAEEKQ
jgi:DNA-binding helix-hairpin-helix protein with protein kinase domain